MINHKQDPIRTTAQSGRMVIWEEIARDGAQGKTLLSAIDRLKIARREALIFGAHGAGHLVFAVGFPAVAPEEHAICQQFVAEADGLSPTLVCRGRKADIEQAVRIVKDVEHARIMIIVPASDQVAAAMTHCAASEAIGDGSDFVKLAKDLAPNVHVDLSYADVPRGDWRRVAEAASQATEAGAGVAVINDSFGFLTPRVTTDMWDELTSQASEDVVFATHFHNDLGLGLANTLAAVSAGARIVSSSLLGLGERVGLTATEQVLYSLAADPAHTSRATGLTESLWTEELNLHALSPLCSIVSERTGVAMGMTHPIVGPGVNSISTGTPFVHPESFRPFDPEAVLGIRATVVLSALANVRVVRAVAGRLGVDLSEEDARVALRWVKQTCYMRMSGTLDDESFLAFLKAQKVRTAA
jgi:isopropylmalate/homocitrate/citramalate synthase